jgi:hypothetical protein
LQGEAIVEENYFMNINHVTLLRRGRLLWIATVLSLSLLALTACAGNSKSSPTANSQPAQPTASGGQPTAPAQASPTSAPQPTAAPTEVPSATPPPAPSDPQQALIDILKSAMQAPPYHVSSTSTTDSGTTTVITGEVALPDHMHIKTSNGTEMLVVGDKSYRKVNGSWQPFSIDIGGILNGMLGGSMGDPSKTVSNVQYLGQDNLNGVSTQVYSFTSSVDLSGETVTSQVKMWVANGLPVRQEINGEFAGVKSKTVQVISYDPSIKIEAPSP